jgi:transposase-like protein
MNTSEISNLDRSMAKVCETCPVCRSARSNQQGLANRFVRGIEEKVCPFCRAYERVHGRKAHEPLEGQ